MSSFWKDKPWGAWSWCLFLLSGGLICHAIIMLTNFAQGLHMGHDGWSSTVYGAGAVAIDLFGVGICSGIAGNLKRSGDIWGARWMTCTVFGSAIFSLFMFYGFNATNRILPAKEAAAKHSAALTAKAQSAVRSDAMVNRLLDDLQADAERADILALDKSRSGADRAAALEHAKELRAKKAEIGFGHIEVQASEVEQVPDAMSQILAEQLGWQVGTVQTLQAVALSGLLILIGSTMIRRSFQGWPTGATPAPAAERPVRQAPPAPAPRPIASRRLTVVPGGTHELIAVDADTQCVEWVNAATREVSNARPQAMDCWRNYAKWARYMRYNELTMQAWGRAMQRVNAEARVNFPRDHTRPNGTVCYVGRALDYDRPWSVADSNLAAANDAA